MPFFAWKKELRVERRELSGGCKEFVICKLYSFYG